MLKQKQQQKVRLCVRTTFLPLIRFLIIWSKEIKHEKMCLKTKRKTLFWSFYWQKQSQLEIATFPLFV